MVTTLLAEISSWLGSVELVTITSWLGSIRKRAKT
jgi:hypothetical protein